MNSTNSGLKAIHQNNVNQNDANRPIHTDIKQMPKPASKQISGMVETLKSQIDIAADRIISNKENQHEDGAAIVFLGNHHDSIPRMLISDISLTSKEIHLWQLMRIAISNPTMPDMMPSQAMLCEYLKSSRTIVSQSITALRIYRWITLCRKVRDKNGRYLGNVYALHTEPLNVAETIYLDDSYLDLVTSNAKGKNKRLAEAAGSMMVYIEDGIAAGDNIMGSPTTQLEQQAKNHMAIKSGSELIEASKKQNTSISEIDASITKTTPCSASATAGIHHVQYLDMVGNQVNLHVQYLDMDESEKLNMDKGLSDHHVQKSETEEKVSNSNTFYHVQYLDTVNSQNLNMDKKHYICSSSLYKKNTTTCSPQENEKPKRKRDPKHEVLENLRYPSALKDSEIFMAKKLILCYVKPDQQQYMLDYLRDRLRAAQRGEDKPVSNPLGYLTKICKALNNGTLHSEQPSSYGLPSADKPKQQATQIDENERFKAQMERYGADPETGKKK